MDPLSRSFPMLTPYQFANNTPIAAIDLDGLEAVIVIKSNWYRNKIINAVKEGDVKEAQRLSLKALVDPAKDSWQRKAFGSYAATLINTPGDGIHVVGITGRRPVNLNFTFNTSEEQNQELGQNVVEYTRSSEESKHRSSTWADEQFKKLNQKGIQELIDVFGDDVADPTSTNTTEGSGEEGDAHFSFGFGKPKPLKVYKEVYTPPGGDESQSYDMYYDLKGGGHHAGDVESLSKGKNPVFEIIDKPRGISD